MSSDVQSCNQAAFEPLHSCFKPDESMTDVPTVTAVAKPIVINRPAVALNPKSTCRLNPSLRAHHPNLNTFAVNLNTFAVMNLVAASRAWCVTAACVPAQPTPSSAVARASMRSRNEPTDLRAAGGIDLKGSRYHRRDATPLVTVCVTGRLLADKRSRTG